MTTDKRIGITIRFTKEERQELEEKVQEHGFANIASLVRYSIKQLPSRKK